jgi:predicted RNA-binding Zn ribbon-like protein
LECIVKQLVERNHDLVPIVSEAYAKHKREKTKPSQQELMALLTQLSKCGKTLFFVLDALDELRTEDRPVLLGFLASLDAKLFVTSRPLDVLQRRFPEATAFNIAAQSSDIELHIRRFFQESPELMELLEGSDDEQHVISAILQKSAGM